MLFYKKYSIMLTMMIIFGKYMRTHHLEFPHLQHFKIRYKSLGITMDSSQHFAIESLT